MEEKGRALRGAQTRKGDWTHNMAKGICAAMRSLPTTVLIVLD